MASQITAGTRLQRVGLPSSSRLLYRRGLTILEVVIAMLILSIMAAAVAPRFFASLSHHRAVAAAERIEVDCRLAQRRARIVSQPQSILFDPASHSYSLPDLQSLQRISSSYVVELDAYPYNAKIVSVDFGGTTELIFDGFGVPQQPGVVIVKSGAEQRTIFIDENTGRATISEP